VFSHFPDERPKTEEACGKEDAKSPSGQTGNRKEVFFASVTSLCPACGFPPKELLEAPPENAFSKKDEVCGQFVRVFARSDRWRGLKRERS
jgi:hypothetical protein